MYGTRPALRGSISSSAPSAGSLESGLMRTGEILLWPIAGSLAGTESTHSRVNSLVSAPPLGRLRHWPQSGGEASSSREALGDFSLSSRAACSWLCSCPVRQAPLQLGTALSVRRVLAGFQRLGARWVVAVFPHLDLSGSIGSVGGLIAASTRRPTAFGNWLSSHRPGRVKPDSSAVASGS